MHRDGFECCSKEAWRALEAWESYFDTQVARLEPEMIKIRRHLHAHPEPSGEEVETSKFVSQRLREAGLEPRILRDGVGVIVDLAVGTPNPDSPLIAIRSDLDALRMPDEKRVDYASKTPGVAHMCGHDAHATVVLAAALAAAGWVQPAVESPHAPGARIRLLFQPAEETSDGAKWLVDQGAMDGVEAILGLHVDPERPVGEVGIRYGILTAHCDEVEILVEGQGGHAARPHHAVDPVAVAARLVSTLYEFLPRSIDSRSPSVLTIGRISGGYAPNVIPVRVELHGSLRTIELHSRERLKQRIAEICAGAEQGSGATIRVRFHRPLAAVDNHPMAAAALEQASRRVVRSDHVFRIERPSMGGEDFSVYLNHAPGALLRLGCAVPGTDAPYLHSPLFDIDERALAIGTRIVLRAAMLLAFGARNSSDEG